MKRSLREYGHFRKHGPASLFVRRDLVNLTFWLAFCLSPSYIISSKKMKMREPNNKLVDTSVAFAVEILNLVKLLKTQRETIISNQIGRSGTSIGANIHEAQYAHGKADFVSKLQIALKEANETSYWLLLLVRTLIITPAEYERLEKLCREIRITLIASINTANGKDPSGSPPNDFRR